MVVMLIEHLKEGWVIDKVGPNVIDTSRADGMIFPFLATQEERELAKAWLEANEAFTLFKGEEKDHIDEYLGSLAREVSQKAADEIKVLTLIQVAREIVRLRQKGESVSSYRARKLILEWLET